MAFPVKLAATVALMALQVGLQMTQRIEGPRLDELSVSVSEYGTPIPRFWGIRRFECPIIWAEDLKEEKVTHKSKGGKYDEYKYYGTFAVVIADHEIDNVTRVWMDRRLVYDKTKEGPVSLGSLLSAPGGVKLSSGENMRVYLGTEDQEVDPRYDAWCEDRYGAGSAPAYRGVAYIVFEDIPLEAFGNRIPQVTVEAVSVSSGALPYEQKTDSGEVGSTGKHAQNGSWLIFHTNGGAAEIEWWDSASRTLLGVSNISGVSAGTVENMEPASDGTLYWFGQYTVALDVHSALWELPPLGSATRIESDTDGAWFAGPTRVFDRADGTRKILTGLNSDFGGTGYLDRALKDDPGHGKACDFCVDGDGNIWIMFQPDGSSDQITLYNLDAETALTVTSPVTRTDKDDAATFCHTKFGHFFIIADGKWLLADEDDGTVLDSGNWSGATNNLPRHNPGADSFFKSYTEVSLEDGSTIQTLDPHDWIVENSDGEEHYDPLLDAIWTRPQGVARQTIRYLNRISGDGVTLATIVNSVCGWCGLSDKDTTALTQVITGYSVTQGSGKDMIDPLLSIHDVDARPHDFSVQFVNRGSAGSGTLLTEDFVRDGERYKVTIRQDTDLPKKLTFKFADVNSDQQTNAVVTQRPLDAMDSEREETIDLTTYVADADTAQQLGDRYLRRIWNSREEVSLALTAQELALEPGDVTAVSLDGTARNVRLSKMTIAGGKIDCVFVRDETTVATLNTATTGPDMGGHDEELIVIPPPVNGFVIDAPLAADADSDVNPLLYTAAGTYGGLAFGGAAIYRGDDGTYDELFETISNGATWGRCLETLDDVSSPWLWDRGNELNVTLESGSLTSATEADIDADPSLNLVLVGSAAGWEYVNFTTATLEADGTYTLSGFKRGRRGTEWMTGSHAAGESFILASSLTSEELGLGDVGDDLSFKAQSIGRPIDAVPAIDFEFTGATLKPYAPARLKWVYDGTDLQGTIIRRTRVGGAWVGGSTIPLGENDEAYEVDILVGGDVVRTISVSDTNAFTYTAAMASADGVTLPTPPDAEVYQLSDSVGRGFALAA